MLYCIVVIVVCYRYGELKMNILNCLNAVYVCVYLTHFQGLLYSVFISCVITLVFVSCDVDLGVTGNFTKVCFIVRYDATLNATCLLFCSSIYSLSCKINAYLQKVQKV